MSGREITSQDRESIRELVAQLGGLANASSLLRIGKATLSNYLSGKATVFGGRICGDRLSALVSGNRDKVFSFLAKEAGKAQKVARESESLRWKIALLEEENEGLRREKERLLSSMGSSPFPFLDLLSAPYAFAHSMVRGLLDEVALVSEDPTRSSFALYREMILFSQLYNAFRPGRISQSDSYFGTVKTLDAIYEALFSYIGIAPDVRFSRIRETMLEQVWRQRPGGSSPKEHEALAWGRMVADLEEVVTAVELTMNREAFKLVVTLQDAAPRLCRQYAIQYILTFHSDLSSDDVKTAWGSSGRILVLGEPVEWQDECRMAHAIRQIVEASRNA